MMNVLVTGGCGFIGSHLVDRLVELGFNVKVYDNLEPQVHLGKKPVYLNKEAEYIFGDLRDKEKLKKVLKKVEIIFHLASQVGVGQSMYEIYKYVDHNCLGTAVLLETVVNTKNKVKKIIVASSMSIYGEGAYKCKNCGVVYPKFRCKEDLKNKIWELKCPKCKRKITPIPTSEEKPLNPTSIYATTKRTQEEMCLEIGSAYKIPVVALRYFNVYGERQSLNNPYTGVCAIFISRIKNNKPPLIFEDGKQTRDFIHVSDVVQANILAMENKNADFKIFNVGRGKAVSILEVANVLISIYKKDIKPKILNKYRAGDIRHCFADVKKIKEELGFSPKVDFEEGMRRLVLWSEDKEAKDLLDKAKKELIRKKLII